MTANLATKKQTPVIQSCDWLGLDVKEQKLLL